jgi:hypothetical protein
MIHPTANDPLIPLTQVPARIQWLPHRRRGRATHPTTILSWAKAGVAGIKLETVRVGGTLCTTETAVREFLQAVTEAESGTASDPAPNAVASPAQDEAMLDAMGVR